MSDLWWYTIAITRLQHPQADAAVSIGATRAAVYQLAGNRLTDVERKALQSALVQNAGGFKESEPVLTYALFWAVVQAYGGSEGVTVRAIKSRMSRSTVRVPLDLSTFAYL